MNRQSEELNKEYFQALGSTRASVRMLSLAWAVRLCHSARHSSININSLVLRCSLY